jgi:predicted unusual protein kinase regulating ubiquinone biosynthesis (AarF/ABC1/UbiB family)
MYAGEYAKRTIEAAFGRPLDTIFRRFDPVAIGAASIGQVHSAELLDGTPVPQIRPSLCRA